MAATALLTGEKRRGKTALFLFACGWAGVAPHWLDAWRSLIPAITLAFVLGGHGLKTVLHDRKKLLTQFGDKSFLDQKQGFIWPEVDILVAARDEEAVIHLLVERLFKLRYPKEKLGIWIIDDGSEDLTPRILANLKKQFPQLNVITRLAGAGGGKSGALNTALTKVKGKWLLVLDADAQLQHDLLERIVLFAENGNWSAVQLRKSVINSKKNLLTKFQAMEMAMDAVIQQGRLASGGIVELRGNGQLIKRDALKNCGGFNEETVTDDLDLSFRFLISKSLIGILWDPPVQEEAVETFPALLKQRQRWAEGGLQRFFDYWPTFLSDRLSFNQRRDLVCFFLLQYFLPVVSMFDIFASLATKTIPIYWPLSIFAFSISGLAFWRGCNAVSEGPELPIPTPTSLFLGIIYLAHWFVVIPWVALRMAIFPKRLVWVKTTHHGSQ